MDRWRRILVMLFCLIFQVGGKICAQETLLFHTLGVNDGLSQSSVYSIYEDKQGFIWMATGDGLNRYDGKEFVTYKVKYSNRADDNFIDKNINSTIAEDKRERLWFYTESGLVCMDKVHNRFTLHAEPLFKCSAAIIGVIDSILWLGVSNIGMVAFNTATNRYTVYHCRERNMSGITQVHSGLIYGDKLLLTDNNGLVAFDRKKKTYERILSGQPLHTLAETDDNRVVIGGTDTVFLYDPSTGGISAISTGTARKGIKWISVTTFNSIAYFGANNFGICRIDIKNKKVEIYKHLTNDPESIAGESVNCVYVDRSGNLWAGIEGVGVSKADLKPKKFYLYSSKMFRGGGDLNVKSIYKDDSAIWIGTVNSGLIIYNPVKNSSKAISFRNNASALSTMISCIIKDSCGRMVIAYGNAIAWLTPGGKLLQKETIPDLPDYRSNDIHITCILEWRKNRYLVGTNAGIYYAALLTDKVHIWHPKAFVKNPYLSAWIYGLYKDNDNNVFVGKREGFVRMSLRNDTIPFIINHDIDDVPVRSFYKPGNSTDYVWVGTESGLLYYNLKDHRYKAFDERGGLPNSYIYSVLEESDSSLWLSTNKGIVNIKVHYSRDGNVAGWRLENFTVADGLQSNEFNTGAYCQAADGAMYFGGIKGINWFYPSQIYKNQYAVRPVITDVNIDDKHFSSGVSYNYIRSMQVPFDKNTISFAFRGLEYTNPAANEFAYQLEDYDKDWIYTHDSKARYANLPPGSYRFLLRASNNDHVWSNEVSSISITVKPAYWQTWWFRMLLVVTAGGIGWQLTRYYIRQKVREKELLLEKQQAINEERSRISKDMHDDIGSGLTKIALISELLERQGKEEKSLVHNISGISRELTQKISDIIWTLNPVNDTLDNLAAYIKEYIGKLEEITDVRLVVVYPETIPCISLDNNVRHQLLMVTKEAVNNALKYADANTITIMLDIAAGQIQWVVRDDGKGFDTGKIADRNACGNGLRNMCGRMQHVNGWCHIYSRLGMGTEIRYGFTYLRN